MLSMVNWAPVIVALAAGIGVLVPASVQIAMLLVNHVIMRDTRSAIGRVEVRTNGELSALRAENTRLKSLLPPDVGRIDVEPAKPI